MAVYFDPQRRGWIDYAAPVLAEIMGGVIKGNNDVRAKKTEYEYGEKAKDAEQARQWGNQNNTLMQLGIQPDESGNFVIPRADSFRGSPEQAFPIIAAIKSTVPGLNEAELLKNLIPPKQWQAINQGDKITAGSFDVGTGDYDGQTYDVGKDPTKVYEADKDLEGKKHVTEGNIKIAGIQQAGETTRTRMSINSRPAPSGNWVQDSTGQWVLLGRDGRPTPSGVVGLGQKEKGEYVPVPTEGGIVIVNKRTGEMVKTPFKPVPKDPFGAKMAENLFPSSVPVPQQGNSAPPSGNPFSGKISDIAYQDLRNSGRSDAEIATELKRLKW